MLLSRPVAARSIAGDLSAVPGSSVVSYHHIEADSPPAVDANASFSIGVDVIGAGGGLLGNASSDLMATVGGVSISSS